MQIVSDFDLEQVLSAKFRSFGEFFFLDLCFIQDEHFPHLN